jgi:hypothetical protein
VSAFGLGSSSKKGEKVEELKKDEEVVPEIYYDSVKKRWVLKGKIYDEEEAKDETNITETVNEKINDNNNNNSNRNSERNLASTQKTTINKPPILPPKVKINKPSTSYTTNQGINKLPTTNKPLVINNEKINLNDSNLPNPLPLSSKTNTITDPFLVKKESTSTKSNSSNIRAPPKINLANRYASLLDQNK